MAKPPKPPKKCGCSNCTASVITPAVWDEARGVWRSRCSQPRAGGLPSNHECYYVDEQKEWIWTSCLSKALGTVKGKTKPKKTEEKEAGQKDTSQKTKNPEESGPSKKTAKASASGLSATKEADPKDKEKGKAEDKKDKKDKKESEKHKDEGKAEDKKDKKDKKESEKHKDEGKKEKKNKEKKDKTESGTTHDEGKKEKKSNEEKDKTESGNPHDAGKAEDKKDKKDKKESEKQNDKGKKEKKSNEEKDKTESGNPHGAGKAEDKKDTNDKKESEKHSDEGKEEKKSKEDKDKTESGNPHDAGKKASEKEKDDDKKNESETPKTLTSAAGSAAEPTQQAEGTGSAAEPTQQAEGTGSAAEPTQQAEGTEPLLPPLPPPSWDPDTERGSPNSDAKGGADRGSKLNLPCHCIELGLGLPGVPQIKTEQGLQQGCQPGDLTPEKVRPGHGQVSYEKNLLLRLQVAAVSEHKMYAPAVTPPKKGKGEMKSEPFGGPPDGFSDDGAGEKMPEAFGGEKMPEAFGGWTAAKLEKGLKRERTNVKREPGVDPLAEAMVRRSQQVLKPGEYLDVLDLMLFCQQTNKVFHLAAYDGEAFRIASSWQMFKEIYPDVCLPELPCDGEEVLMLMCRADLHPSTHGSLNHFIPLWKAEKLSDSALLKIRQKSEAELAFLKALRQSEGMGAAWNAVRETAENRIDEIGRWKQMQDWLWNGGGLVASEVPADGNCGVWSLLSFINKTTEVDVDSVEQKLECLKIRQQISKGWTEVMNDETWKTLFELLINTFDQAAAEPAEEAEEVKKEPLLTTPPKKRKPDPPAFIDLSTPPKDLGGGKRVKGVGGQRAALRVKQSGEPINPMAPPCPRPDDPELPGEEGDAPKMKKQKQSQNLKEKLEDVAFGGSVPKKCQPKDSGAEADKDQEGDGGEGAAEKVKKRHRTCKRKQKTDDDRVAEVVQTYLGSIGVTWLSHQHFHARESIVGPGAPKCNKFTAMQASLQEAKLPECLTCRAMLQTAGFDMNVLRDMMNDVDATCPSPGVAKWKQLRKEFREVQVQGGEDPGEESLDENEELPADLQELSDCMALVPFHDVPLDEELQAPAEKGNEQAQDQGDVWEIVRKNSFLEVLPLNSHDRRVPIRCKVCRSRNQPEGKIIEADVPKKNSVINFVRQHCKRPQHLSNMRKWLEEMKKDAESEKEPSEMRACVGLSLCNSEKKLSDLKAEIVNWARLVKLSQVFGKHKYIFDLSTDELTVFHSDCEKVLPCRQSDSSPAVCNKCRTSSIADTAVRSAVRFALKYFGAQLLQHRLFKSDEATAELIDGMKATNLYRINPGRIDEVIAMKDSDLQNNMRNSWLKMRRDSCTPQLIMFIDNTIRPSLLVNVEECTGEFRQLSNQFTAQLAGGGVAELQQLGMRIMKATCSGKLLSHPCIMGIVLQCIDVVNREERGIHTLKQPRKMGDKEQALIQQAGLLLTSNGCSGDLMRAMGFSKLFFLRSHSNLDSLLSQGLPCAPLALLKPSVMQQNVALISQMLPPLPGLASKQRMVLCFDFTYLLPLHTPMTLHEEKGLAGGPFSIGHESIAFHRLGQPLLDDVKASRMMEFLLWDPSCKSKQTLSPVFLPLALKWMGEGTELGSSWEVFRIIDLVLSYVSEHVRVVICDGEGCNNHIKQVIQGTLPPDLRRKMHGFQLLKNVCYKEIEALSSVPGLRPKLCYIHGNLMYGLPAPAHSAKNSSAQLLSESKLLYYGMYFADPTGCLEYNMPVPAYTRKDAMSDRLNSLLTCPLFMLPETAVDEHASWNEVQIPWHLRGLLLWNLSTALCVAPALHGGLSLAQRCEVAIAGHICLDLWHLVAEARAKKMHVPWHKIVLASQTRKNLQGCALGVISICASKDPSWDPWREPHGLSEVKIEHRFGQLRAQFAGGDMSARGYWKANARLLRQMGRTKDKRIKEPKTEPPLDASQLRECADKALEASLQLVSRCSQISVECLETLYRTGVEDGLIEEDKEVEDMLLEDVIISEFDNGGHVNEIETALTEIQHLAEEEFEDEDPENDKPPDAEDQDKHLPDGLQLVDLTKESKSETKMDTAKFPLTLSEALSGDGGFWAGLWQLTVSLRCGENGVDSKFLRKAEVVRRRSRKLNWQQSLEHSLKEMREQQDETMAGQRGSRIAKWIQSSAELRQKAGLSSPEKLKIGNVVVLNLGHGVQPVPALVLTVWPASKKPRPCVQEVEISRVKCFRGVLLQEGEDPEKPCHLVPTDFVWRYIYQQVVAVLDVEESNLYAGRIVVSKASMHALSLAQEQQAEQGVDETGQDSAQEEQDASGHKAKGRGKGKGKGARNFKRVRDRLKKQAEATSKKKTCDVLDADAIQADDIRRSDKGRRAIRRAVQKACDLDKLNFSSSPTFDAATHKCTLKEKTELVEQDFVYLSPLYFQYLYFSCRNGDAYGKRVHSDLEKVLRELRATPPARKAFVAMVTDFFSAKLKGRINV